MKTIRAKTKTGLVAALDVGSSKVTCAIARVGPSRMEGGAPEIRIIGVGNQLSQGVKGGAIIEMDLAEAAIGKAVNAAEKVAGETIDEVHIGMAGGQPMSEAIDFDVSIAGHPVGEADLERVLGQVGRLEVEPGRELVHSIPTGFSIDGSNGIRDPRGMSGERLGTHMHMVTAASGPMRNLANVVERCHLQVAGFVVSSYAAGLACLVKDEKELGVTLIDLGGGTTSFAVFTEGTVVHTDSIGIGGTHVTSDIARGLSTPLAEAERLKTLFGSATVSTLDDRETIEVPVIGEDAHTHPNTIPRSTLTRIIQPRLEETFEIVRARLEAAGVDRIAGNRVVLTGGASQMPGIRDLAQSILDKQVRLGRPIHVKGLADSAAGPVFSACAGIVGYAVDPALDASPDRAMTAPPASSSFFGRVGSWLRENF